MKRTVSMRCLRASSCLSLKGGRGKLSHISESNSPTPMNRNLNEASQDGMTKRRYIRAKNRQRSLQLIMACILFAIDTAQASLAKMSFDSGSKWLHELRKQTSKGAFPNRNNGFIPLAGDSMRVLEELAGFYDSDSGCSHIRTDLKKNLCKWNFNVKNSKQNVQFSARNSTCVGYIYQEKLVIGVPQNFGRQGRWIPGWWILTPVKDENDDIKLEIYSTIKNGLHVYEKHCNTIEDAQPGLKLSFDHLKEDMDRFFDNDVDVVQTPAPSRKQRTKRISEHEAWFCMDDECQGNRFMLDTKATKGPWMTATVASKQDKRNILDEHSTKKLVARNWEEKTKCHVCHKAKPSKGELMFVQVGKKDILDDDLNVIDSVITVGKKRVQ